MVRDIDAYLATRTGIQPEWRGRPVFGKKGPHCFHLWVQFSIQNVVLRVSRRKNSKKCGVFFSCVFDEMFIKPLVPQNLSCPETFLVRRLHSGIVPFAKCYSILNV